MDRCRCAEYQAAVDKLRFYTVGTHRPEIIANYDRTGYNVGWIPHKIDTTDLTFEKAKAKPILEKHEMFEHRLSPHYRRIEQMWCPYMTPRK